MGEYLGMNFNSSKVRVLFIALALGTSLLSPVFAQENVISSIVISKSKENNQAYELNIDSSEIVQYKSHIDSEGNVYFDLKNSTLAPGMGTIYDDVSEIDNVTVKQLDRNKVRIYVSGKNARNTELIFVNSIFETTQQNSKNVVINRPINEYKSTTYNNDLEYQDDIQEWDDNSFNLTHLSSSIFSELKEGVFGKILIFLALFSILMIIVKNLASKISQDREPLIGLSNKKAIENELNIGTNANIRLQAQAQAKMRKTDDLVSISQRNETIRKAQIELTRAHQKYQEYIQNKYKNAPKPRAIDTDAVRKSFALNQYQKSTQNPYSNQEVIKLRPNTVSKAQTPQRSEFTSPYIKRTTNLVKNEEIQPRKPQGQNMRFLDSVTKIYERTGRGDLADGLKNTMTKAKQTI